MHILIEWNIFKHFSKIKNLFQKSYSFFQTSLGYITASTIGYNEFDLFLEIEEYRPFNGCKNEI
jgi:hypothetical protein